MEWVSLVLSASALIVVLVYIGVASPGAKRKRLKRILEQVPELDRGQEHFKRRYPRYEYGTGSYGMPNVKDFREGTTLKIGAYCSIANGVLIVLGGNHRTDWITTYPFPAKLKEASHIKGYDGSRGDVIIGSDVWLCTNSTILSGVTIGHGAVVAAGSLVNRDVAPYSIVAGNPARVIGWRFDEPTREALVATNWWHWPKEEVASVVEQLCSDDIVGFLEYARNRRQAT
ncbi:CatB-related O-acetyltransferase [Pseudomonas sp. M30-35]|uniref:CatB-related O-acetyltransferase n=1 Tax=Pseudomonas sp. M30-35 TaxID=1981174 RepID=UPI000B3C6DAB|nr:CatB-related O-acetyltransferase [Pseudomonas sp. M30-35]ARU86839.1 acetyltransferase [Pseudomonas sp. M30-35]